MQVKPKNTFVMYEITFFIRAFAEVKGDIKFFFDIKKFSKLLRGLKKEKEKKSIVQ